MKQAILALVVALNAHLLMGCNPEDSGIVTEGLAQIEVEMPERYALEGVAMVDLSGDVYSRPLERIWHGRTGNLCKVTVLVDRDTRDVYIYDSRAFLDGEWHDVNSAGFYEGSAVAQYNRCPRPTYGMPSYSARVINGGAALRLCKTPPFQAWVDRFISANEASGCATLGRLQ